MKKLAKYLKPYTFALLLSLVMLFAQAVCDLSLPNLMSRIVTVGIQQGGIEETAPKAISEKGFTLMRTFMDAQDKETLDTAYERIETGSDAAKDYVNSYPLLATDNIYVLRGGRDVGNIFGKSTMAFVSYAKDMAQSQSGASGTSSSAENLKNVDFAQIYAMLPMLQKMPDSAFESARTAADSTDPSMLSQMGITMAKQFYTELGMDTGAIQTRRVLNIGAQMLLLTLLGAIATVLVGFFSARISAGVAKTLRSEVFRKVESFSNSEFDRYSTASLITRTTNDVTQVQMLLMMGIRMICYAPILGVGGVIMALRTSTSMSWIIALGIVIMIAMILVVFKVAMPKFKIIQKLIDRLNLIVRESLSGIMVIRAFNTQKFEENRFEKANRNLTDTNLFVNRVMVFMMPAMMLIMNGISLMIVWVGGHQIEQSALQVGDMMAFIQYAMQIIMAFLMISMMFIMVPRAAVSADRVAEVLETRVSITDSKNPKTINGRARGKLEFRHVYFRYNNAETDVLEDLTFTAQPGKTTAFIGSTGSGKTTLINLIPRFYDVTGGEILLDGININELSQHELRENIGYVPQTGILFSGDIASNLRYGVPNASDDEIALAADIAQATEFIESTESGMHNDISQGGANVSGGQKQRLSIARALVKKAPVYIFDDSFSALDFKTDAALRKALKTQTGDSTVLIVAQRVSTIMNADQIIVLDEGKIVGIGTHGELLENCRTYKEIASSQLSKEELQ